MALCLVLGLLRFLRGILPPSCSPICASQRAARRKWGKDNFNLGVYKDIHSNFTFTFPKFDVVFVAFGKGRDGAIARPAPPRTSESLRHVDVRGTCLSWVYHLYQLVKIADH